MNKIVDIIRPSSINAIIGPVGTLKRILGDRLYFEGRGYSPTIYTYESYIQGGLVNRPSASELGLSNANNDFIQKLKKLVGRFLWNGARFFNPFAIILLEIQSWKVKKLVQYYVSQNRTPDIVQFHSNLEAFYYLRLRTEHKAKTIMFLHTDGYPHKMMEQYFPQLKNSRYFKKFKEDYEWTIKNVDRIGFIARIAQKNFLECFPNRSLDDTSVIINGIDDLTSDQKADVNQIRSNENSGFKFRMCCSGTINNRKGHRIIIEALHKLSPDLVKDIHVDFLGEGAERKTLENLVTEYHLENNIKFHGLVPNEVVYKFLAKNNIYILMSKNEGLPISIIEAMRASLMIISTNVSGIPELINPGFNGELLPPEVDSLVTCLEKLRGMGIEQMGKNSRIRFELEFGFDRMEKELCDMYDIELNNQYASSCKKI